MPRLHNGWFWMLWMVLTVLWEVLCVVLTINTVVPTYLDLSRPSSDVLNWIIVCVLAVIAGPFLVGWVLSLFFSRRRS
jgi:hypothetical protein